MGLSLTEVGTRQREAFPIDGATIAADFANGRYYNTTLATLITVTRSSSKTDLLSTSAPGAAWRTYAVDVPMVVAGRGLSNEEARTNSALYSTAPATQSINVTAGTTYTVWVNAGFGGSATIAGGTAAVAAIPAGWIVPAAGGADCDAGRVDRLLRAVERHRHAHPRGHGLRGAGRGGDRADQFHPHHLGGRGAIFG